MSGAAPTAAQTLDAATLDSDLKALNLLIGEAIYFAEKLSDTESDRRPRRASEWDVLLGALHNIKPIYMRLAARASALPAAPEPDTCAVCGLPKSRHSGGTPNYCPIIPSFRAPALAPASEPQPHAAQVRDAVLRWFAASGVPTPKCRDIDLWVVGYRAIAAALASPSGAPASEPQPEVDALRDLVAAWDEWAHHEKPAVWQHQMRHRQFADAMSRARAALAAPSRLVSPASDCPHVGCTLPAGHTHNSGGPDIRLVSPNNEERAS